MNDGTASGRAASIARWCIRRIARLVPAARREEWREEWEAETWHAIREPAVGGGVRVWRLLAGALPHALWLRSKEGQRSGWSMNGFVTDVRYAVRTLRRSPGFGLIAILTIGLGIGANTAVFSVVDGLLVRAPRYRDPDRVVHLGWQWEPGTAPISALTGSQFEWLREHTQAFEGVTTWRPFSADIGVRGEGGEVTGLRVSEDFFRVIGVSPRVGRAFLPEEQEPGGGSDVVIVSDRFWRERLGSDGGVIGSEIPLYGRTLEVVGVMPPEFEFQPASESTSLLMPLRFEASLQDQGHNLEVMARLSPGVSVAQAEADLDRVFAAMRQAHPELIWRDHDVARLSSYRSLYLSEITPALWVLMGAVLLVLLISCANVSNLLLARGTTRNRELAVRATLGARRSRIASQVLAESGVLALAGGVFGFFLGYAGLKGLLRLAPSTIPGLDRVQLDGRVAAYTLAASLLAGLVFGLIAAIPALRRDLMQSVRDGQRAGTGRRAVLGRNVLIGVESAVAVMLLAGAGLLISSFAELSRADLGYEAAGLSTIRFRRVPQELQAPATARDFEERLLATLESMPGVMSAASSNQLPVDARYNIPVTVEGRPDATFGGTEIRTISRGYFDVLGMTVVAGRGFDVEDARSSRPVIVINESLARRFWPDGDAIGSRMRLGYFQGENVMPGFADPPREVIGVVRDIRENGPARSPRLTMYVARSPGFAIGEGVPGFIVRMRTGVTPQQLQAAVESIDARAPVARIDRIESLIGSSLAQERFNTTLMTTFALAALLLTAIGIYGVVGYTVRQRRAEIGLRMALGARRSVVLGDAIRDGMLPVGLGLLAGIGLSLGLTRFLAGMLHGASPTDPLTFTMVVGVLCAVALTACYIPSRRAAAVDPMIALRTE